MKRSHGGDLQGFLEKYGREPIDFSTNLSQGEMPESVKLATAKALEEMDRYPDPLCRKLVSKISEHSGIKEEYILCGNGAADLIYRFVLAVRAKKALVTAPAFSEYEEALELTGTEVVKYMLSEEDDFRIQEDYLDEITSDLDVIFLCEPGNPTGVTTDINLLKRIIDKAAEENVLVFLDECFNEFLDEPESHSVMGDIERYGNLLILKSFTKIYRMPGARLGYAVSSNEKLIENMRTAGQSWPVSVFAREIGIAYLEEKDYMGKALAGLKEERERISSSLRELGMNVMPCEANYILFKAEAGLDERLAEKGILIRNCSNYDGLDENWFRIGINSKEHNTKLIEAIRDVKES